MRKLGLKPWEIALSVLAIALSLASATALLSGISLRRILPGADSDRSRPIGKVASFAGTLKREFSGQMEFNTLTNSEPLFHRDIVVTGSDSEAVLELDNGDAIVLGPQTMVLIEAPPTVALPREIFKIPPAPPKVQIVTGEVAVRAYKGEVVVKSRSGREIQVQPRTKQAFRSSADRPALPASDLEIIETPKQLITADLADDLARTTQGTSLLPEDAQGAHSRAAKPTLSFYTPVPVAPTAPAAPVTPVAPPVPVPTAKPVARPKTKPIARPQPSQGPARIKLSAKKALVLPRNNSRFSLKKLKKSGSTILMTWNRQRGATAYRLDIATDPEFNRLTYTGTTAENFHLFVKPKPGKYWWRIRTIEGFGEGFPCDGYEFTVVN